MQIGKYWKIALKCTFSINLNGLNAIILHIYMLGMCSESFREKKFFCDFRCYKQHGKSHLQIGPPCSPDILEVNIHCNRCILHLYNAKSENIGPSTTQFYHFYCYDSNICRNFASRFSFIAYLQSRQNETRRTIYLIYVSHFVKMTSKTRDFYNY